MQKKILLILLFSFIIAFFAIQNASPVLVKIFYWEKEVSLAFIVLGAIAFGAFLMALVSSFKQLKLGKEIRLLKREKEKLIKDIEDMDKTIGVLRTELNKDKPGTGDVKEEGSEEDNLDNEEA